MSRVVKSGPAKIAAKKQKPGTATARAPNRVLDLIGVDDFSGLVQGESYGDKRVAGRRENLFDQGARCIGFGYLQWIGPRLPPMIAASISDADIFYVIAVRGGRAAIAMSTRKPLSADAQFELVCHLIANDVAMHGVKALDTMILTSMAAAPVPSWTLSRPDPVERLRICHADLDDRHALRSLATFLKGGDGVAPLDVRAFSSVMAMRDPRLIPGFMVESVPRAPETGMGRMKAIQAAARKRAAQSTEAGIVSVAVGDLLDEVDMESIESISETESAESGAERGDALGNMSDTHGAEA